MTIHCIVVGWNRPIERSTLSEWFLAQIAEGNFLQRSTRRWNRFRSIHCIFLRNFKWKRNAPNGAPRKCPFNVHVGSDDNYRLLTWLLIFSHGSSVSVCQVHVTSRSFRCFYHWKYRPMQIGMCLANGHWGCLFAIVHLLQSRSELGSGLGSGFVSSLVTLPISTESHIQIVIVRGVEFWLVEFIEAGELMVESTRCHLIEIWRRRFNWLTFPGRGWVDDVTAQSSRPISMDGVDSILELIFFRLNLLLLSSTKPNGMNYWNLQPDGIPESCVPEFRNLGYEYIVSL